MPIRLEADVFYWTGLLPEQYAHQLSLWGDEQETAHPREAKGTVGAHHGGEFAKKAEKSKNLPVPSIEKPIAVPNTPVAEIVEKPDRPAEGKKMEAKTRTIKTAAGTDVNLSIDRDGAHFSVQLPGKMGHGKITGWAEKNGRKVAMTDAWHQGAKGAPQSVSLSITKAEYDEAMSDVKAAKDEEIADIKNGKTPIEARYSDGEYLSGYTVYGKAGELLETLGVAHEVNGWGIILDNELIEKLGKTFTYPQAAEYAQPRLDAEKKKSDEKAAARKAKFDEARTSGKPVLLHSGTEQVSEREERETENSMNIVKVYAMPDGTTKTTRHGTY